MKEKKKKNFLKKKKTETYSWKWKYLKILLQETWNQETNSGDNRYELYFIRYNLNYETCWFNFSFSTASYY